MFGQGTTLTGVGLGVADLLGNPITLDHLRNSEEDRLVNRAIAAQAIVEAIESLHYLKMFLIGISDK